MAGVLDALASYVTNMITEMAKEEVAMLIGVSGELDTLSVKLRDLKNFLADADRRNITDTSVQAWVEELKRAMYDATDILDLCQLKVMEEGPSKDMGCLNPLLFCMRDPLHAHDIGSRIKTLNQKLDDICKRGGIFNFIKLEAYQDRNTTRPPIVNRKTDPLLERSAMVGEKIEEDTRMLVEMLTKDAEGTSGNIMVFAIVGIGGIGKTTLSKNVYNNEAIQGKFTKKIWLSITQEFNEVDLLRTAITAADGNMPGPGDGSEDKALLVPALASAIKDKKFFLVLDDMWGDREWNNLLKAPFSHGAAGSRVLVTTRHAIIARGMKAVTPYHHVDKLDTEDAWSLLKKQVLTTELNDPAVDMLKDIGLQIIGKCDGLPLAIKVMGGLLCLKEKERCDWEKVLNDAIWSVIRMPEELNYAIYLSYEDLSPWLKQCFLHIALKPKKAMFTHVQFVGMWIAEGFIHGDLDRLEEIGIGYHKELILRNLIEPDTSGYGYYVCNMHDLVRSFAQFVTRGEALIGHNGENIDSKLSLQKFLRLSVETKGMQSNGFKWKSLQDQKSLRSVILIGNFKIQSGDSLISFSSLRTLHVESADFSPLVKYLYQLKHLRYLTLQKCNDIISLPKNIHKMKFLQHIGLEDCVNLMKLPESLIKLHELRFLDLDRTCVNSMPRGFRALTNLRALYGFPAHVDGDWCSLEELGPLSQLIHLGLKGLENVEVSSSASKAMLGAKVHLTYMKLGCRLDPSKLLQEQVFDELYPPSCIEDIIIEGFLGHQLPRWMMSTETTSFKSLKFLTMRDLSCCTQLPDGLCLLPCLDYLDISEAPGIKLVGPQFVQPYNHRNHASSSQAVATFPKLHQLFLVEMVEWEEWKWAEEVQAMPLLEKFSLKCCKLRCIPPGLPSHAMNLRKMSLCNVQHLQSVENFASVVELELLDNPDMTGIFNFPKLQKLEISWCPKLDSLQEVSALRRLLLTISYSKRQLPVYLQTVKPSHLLLNCSPKVLSSMAAGKSGSEWDKFSHIQHVEAYAEDFDGGIGKRWHLLYTSEPYSMETNMDLQDSHSLKMQ